MRIIYDGKALGLYNFDVFYKFMESNGAECYKDEFDEINGVERKIAVFSIDGVVLINNTFRRVSDTEVSTKNQPCFKTRIEVLDGEDGNVSIIEKLISKGAKIQKK